MCLILQRFGAPERGGVQRGDEVVMGRGGREVESGGEHLSEAKEGDGLKNSCRGTGKGGNVWNVNK